MSKSPALPWLLLGLAACTPQTFRADVGALFATADGRIALQNAGGSLQLGSSMNDLDQHLGVGEQEGSPYVRLQWEHQLHRVRVHGFGFEAEGAGTLVSDYGGIVAGSAVSTSMKFFAADASYSYEVWGNRHVHVGLGAQLGLYSLDIAARSGAGREAVATDLLAPMPFLEVETYIGPLTLGVNGSVIAGRFRDADGRYGDVEGYARFQATDEIDVIAGYRYLVMDADGTATARDFDADIYVQGWFIGGGVRF